MLVIRQEINGLGNLFRLTYFTADRFTRQVIEPFLNITLTDVTVPADTPFVIAFDNQDAGIPHNVAISDASGVEVFKGEIINGVATVEYQVPALPAGEYTFICTVHPNMTGTMTAQ